MRQEISWRSFGGAFFVFRRWKNNIVSDIFKACFERQIGIIVAVH